MARARQGFLPAAGGVDDQDALFVEAWTVLEQAQGMVAGLQAQEQARKHEQALKTLADQQKRRRR